jgi:hypothetical protein
MNFINYIKKNLKINLKIVNIFHKFIMKYEKQFIKNILKIRKNKNISLYQKDKYLNF